MSDPIRTPPPVIPAPSAMTAAQRPAPQGRGEAQRLAREFEGVFAGQVVKIMMETAEVKSDFTGGSGESMFRGILAEQIGNQIGQTGGLGIASVVEAQIIRLQEGKP